MHRNKVGEAALFLNKQFKGLLAGLSAFQEDGKNANQCIPDHIFSTAVSKLIQEDLVKLNASSKETSERFKEFQTRMEKSIGDVLHEISKSTDEVSASLDEIFRGAIEANANELDLARKRKEVGRAPGKKATHWEIRSIGNNYSVESIRTPRFGSFLVTAITPLVTEATLT